MSANDNQKTTGAGVTPLSLRIANLMAWSVQGSNLRPPVSEAPPSPDNKWRSLCVLRGISRRNARRIGETAKPKDNETTIVVPHVLDRTPLKLLVCVKGCF